MQFTEKMRLTHPAVALSKIYGFWRSFILALFLAALSVSGAFEPFDGFIYDFFVRHSLDLNPVKRKVVLVESPASAFSDSAIRWDTLADGLLALGAAQVVFTDAPATSDAIADALKKNPKVVLAANTGTDTMQSGSLHTSDGVDAHGISAIVDPLFGVHRHQRYAYRVGDSEVPSMEALAAQQLGIEVPKEGRYLVDFTAGSQGFPRAKLQQVLDGKLIDAVVRDRVVLIGPSGDRFHRAVVTPITAANREVSELEYHGYALDSLLRGTPVATLHPVAGAAMLIGIWLMCVLILQPMPFRKAMLIASCVVLGFAGLSFLLLLQQFHLPVFGAILVIGCSLVSIFHSKTEHQNQALARLVTDTNLAASGRLTGQRVSVDDAFWSHVLAMVDQILPLTRVVLLARQDEADHVREIRSLRCSVDSIEERRRDFGRAPYSTAVEKGGTIEVRRYLKNAPVNEYQFLLPLTWSGQVLGFLAFGIHQSRLVNGPSLMHAADVLGKRLSELMFERRQRMVHTAAGSWRDYLIDQRDLAIQNLAQHLHMIDRHIDVLEDMFNGLDAPTMVYDLFGRPLMSNVRMKSLLQTADIDAEELSAADLMEAVCPMSSDEARVALVSVVFDGDTVERTAHVGNARYRLHVSRLRNSAANASRSMSGQDVLQHIHGLMIQLIPVTHPEKRERQRVERLSADRESSAGRPPRHDAQEEEVDVLHAVKAAIASTASSPEHESLRFAIDTSRHAAKALAHPKKLKDILTALMQFLAEDSKQSGKLTVTLNTSGNRLVIGLRNNGFGMPNEKLQAMLEGPALPKSDYLRRIRQLRDSAFGPQGQLALYSTVGGGYVAKATMLLVG